MELKTPTKRHAKRTLARSFASPLLDPRLASHRLPTLARGAEALRAHPPRMVETQCFLPSVERACLSAEHGRWWRDGPPSGKSKIFVI